MLERLRYVELTDRRQQYNRRDRCTRHGPRNLDGVDDKGRDGRERRSDRFEGRERHTAPERHGLSTALD